jgi:hypothetical protein
MGVQFNPLKTEERERERERERKERKWEVVRDATFKG